MARRRTPAALAAKGRARNGWEADTGLVTASPLLRQAQPRPPQQQVRRQLVRRPIAYCGATLLLLLPLLLLPPSLAPVRGVVATSKFSHLKAARTAYPSLTEVFGGAYDDGDDTNANSDGDADAGDAENDAAERMDARFHAAALRSALRRPWVPATAVEAVDMATRRRAGRAMRRFERRQAVELAKAAAGGFGRRGRSGGTMEEEEEETGVEGVRLVSNSDGGARLVVVAPTNTGLGNYVFKVVTAVLLAILTDRGVVIDGRGSKAAGFLEFFAPPMNFTAPPHALAARDVLAAADKAAAPRGQAIPADAPAAVMGAAGAVSGGVHWWNRKGFELCKPMDEVLTEKNTVIAPDFWFGGTPYNLWRHPTHRERLRELFGDVPMYFLSNWFYSRVVDPSVTAMFERERTRLFGPLPPHVAAGGDDDGNAEATEAEAEEAAASRGKHHHHHDHGLLPAPRDDTFVLGVQLRNGRGLNDFYLSGPEDQRKFYICAAAALRSVLTAADAPSHAAIMLSTDTVPLRAELQAYLDEHPDPIIRGNIRVLHVQAGLKDGLKADGNMRLALVDQLLLAEADDLIVTRWSTYGYAVQTRLLHKPLFVSRTISSCMRMTTSHQGLTSLGGGWPWGEALCDNNADGIPQPCCLTNRDEGMTTFPPI